MSRPVKPAPPGEAQRVIRLNAVRELLLGALTVYQLRLHPHIAGTFSAVRQRNKSTISSGSVKGTFGFGHLPAFVITNQSVSSGGCVPFPL